MTTSYPAPLASAESARRTSKSPISKPLEADPPRSWRYNCRPQSHRILILAGLISAALHAGFLFGFGPTKKKTVAPKPDNLLVVSLIMPHLEELEEPEPVPTDDSDPPPDLGVLVPMQQDLPQIPRAADFVQQINFASLIEPPDFSQAKIIALPDHIRTAGKLGEKFGKIFDLAALDRIPEAVVQPPPIYPISLKQEGIRATVEVEFVVDSEGRVRNSFVVASTDSRFDDAAVIGVARWKFRPGMKAGRKVNTRMRVPLVFHVVDNS